MSCARGHSFDVARSGYVNLLQPQDRRSSRPGDYPEVLVARRRWLARGFEAPFLDAVAATAAVGPESAILEVGCGEGDHLAELRVRWQCEAHGVDISVAAIEAAARRDPLTHWVVANADRRLPYTHASFRLVCSIMARRNAAEFRRVLRGDGTLVLVVPAPDDLHELRAAVLGEAILRDRVPATTEALAPLFRLARHERLRRVVRLDTAAIRDVMIGSYRGLRTQARTRLAAVGEIDVTLGRDLLVFRPTGRNSAV